MHVPAARAPILRVKLLRAEQNFLLNKFTGPEFLLSITVP